MDIFEIVENSEKAGNVTGGQLVKTSIDWKNETIMHEYELQTRDSDNDPILPNKGFKTVKLSPEEFQTWIQQAMIDASKARLAEELNIKPIEQEDPAP